MKAFLLVPGDIFVCNFPSNFVQMPALRLLTKLPNEFQLRP